MPRHVAGRKTDPPPATVGTRFVRHVRGTRWYRSGLADRIPRRHKLVRPLAHVVLGAAKIAGYAAAGASVGVYEGSRRAAPAVRRHIRRRMRPKWATSTPEDKRTGWKVRHHLLCVCGDTFTSLDELNGHYATSHHDEERQPRPQPTLHTVRAGRHAGKFRVRPVTGAPPGRHRVTKATAGHHKATSFAERHRAAITERGKKIMSDTNSEAARVARAWGHVGDALPRSTEEVMNLVIGLMTAASEEADAIRAVQKTLLTRLNMDPTVVHGLTVVADMADTKAAAWTAVLNTIETVYGPYLALIRQGISVPTN